MSIPFATQKPITGIYRYLSAMILFMGMIFMTGKSVMKNHDIQTANIFLVLHNTANMTKIDIKKVIAIMNETSRGCFTRETA